MFTRGSIGRLFFDVQIANQKMGHTIIIIALLCSLDIASCKEICCDNGDCYDNSPPFDLPLIPLPICPEKMEPIFLLYTRGNRDTPEELDRFKVPPEFDGSRTTVILVHGYRNDHTKGWLQRAKNAMLEREDANVVVVGWRKGATVINYFKAVANSRVIATEISYVIKNLYSAGAAPSRMWCVGHSLGAHVCGRTGKISKYARITGLDPAGPVWDDIDFSAGLTKGDADFVDTIHSHGQGLIPWGTMLARGHLDFYPNDGDIQPGCFTYDLKHAFGHILARGHSGTKWDEMDIDANCSHSRAKEYFIESIAEPCFRATSKCTDFNNIPGSCSPCAGSNCPYMGYDANASSPHGLYNLPTGSAEPYCIN